MLEDCEDVSRTADRLIAVDLQDGVTCVLNSDYFGESIIPGKRKMGVRLDFLEIQPSINNLKPAPSF